MMDLDEAIQHCREQVQEQAKKGCYSCAEEHQQLAEWLKELKAYREQRGERMNVEEKERLIKKDIASIENRVRHAFNQGYEMGLKESRSENPNTCGDAISRQSAIFLASDLKQDLPDDERIADMVMAHNEGILEYQTQLSLLPSVIPQQRTGRWIEYVEPDDAEPLLQWRCDKCGTIERRKTHYCPHCGAKMEVEE